MYLWQLRLRRAVRRGLGQRNMLGTVGGVGGWHVISRLGVSVGGHSSVCGLIAILHLVGGIVGIDKRPGPFVATVPMDCGAIDNESNEMK